MNKELLEYSWSQHKKTGSFVPLLALLERPLPEAKSLILSLNVETFPYEQLISFALSGDVSDYWAALAVDWLEQGVGINETIARNVYAMIKRKWASQRTRHRAYRLVKRWERIQAA